jgi:glycosyltransferase involved in cell wall biosynthesis
MLAISQFAAETAAAELAFPIERMRVIGAGVEPAFAPAEARPLPRPDRVLPVGLAEPVVAVTGGDERKNTEGLLRGWARVAPELRRAHPLVIATAAAPAVLERWAGWASELGVIDDVVITGEIEDDEMVALLQRAALAVMPSLEEGFGLPVVEAAACGCPVVCSDRSSLPEILPEPAAWFDPLDPDAIARSITRALTDGRHRQVLTAAASEAAARWQWRQVGTDTVAALTALGPRWPRPRRHIPVSVALAGPFAGSTSGIGRYDEEVLEALRRLERGPEIAVYVDGSGTDLPTDVAAGRWPVRALPRSIKPWDHDHVVAVLGSSPHHIATAQLASRRRCHLWLHEASLVGVWVGLGHQSGSERWARDLVTEQLRADGRDPDELAAAGIDPLDAEALDRGGIDLLAPLVTTARSVIVSSERAALAVGGAAARLGVAPPPTLVVPLAHRPVVARRRPADRTDLVAVGWLGHNKAPHVLLDVLERLPGTALTFVGPAVTAVRALVDEEALRRGLDARISFTGRLTDEAYFARLAGARVAVQLRDGDRGEMSGAVADLQAAGVPTVTTLATAPDTGPGLQVVALDPDLVVAAVAPLLDDDTAWSTASDDALARAAAWTYDDVARALVAWLSVADELPAGTVQRSGPRSAAPA